MRRLKNGPSGPISLAVIAITSGMAVIGCSVTDNPSGKSDGKGATPTAGGSTASSPPTGNSTANKPFDYGRPNVDARGTSAGTLAAPPPSATASAQSLAQKAVAQGATVRFSSKTGAASRLSKLGAPLSAASAKSAEAVALEYLAANGALFNVSAGDLAKTKFVRNFKTKHNGVTHLTLQFLAKGLDVFESQLAINVTQQGQVINVAGEPIHNAEAYINTETPQISSADALTNAANDTSVQAVLRPSFKGLAYFAVDATHLRLAWRIEFSDADSPNMYDTLVDAVDGRLLWRKLLTNYQHGEVYVEESPVPDVPIGTGAGAVPRVDTDFNGGDFFAAGDVHFDWWNGVAPTTTTSNNVDAYADVDSDNAPDAGSRPTAGAGNDFTFPINLTQSPLTWQPASVVNLFYWGNRLHDYFYDKGFDEAAGNFQTANFGLGGLGGDALLAEAHDGANNPKLRCNSWNNTPGDGSPPRVEMWLCDAVAPELDTGLDSYLVGHEYAHGIHVRLVNISGNQQAGEGWADYLGLGPLLESTDPYDGQYGFGNYGFNAPNTGVRSFPYSTDTSVFSLSYNDLPNAASCTTRTCSNNAALICDEDTDCAAPGTCPWLPCSTDTQCKPPVTTIDQGTCVTEVHFAGSIWANALHIVRFNLIAKYGFDPGLRTSDVLVLDGMKLSPANPTFLDGRDAILSADQVNNAGANACLIWDGFAKTGMGFSATTTGVNDLLPVEAYDLPPACRATATLSGTTNLGDTCPGDAVTETLTISNTGQGELIVTSVERVAGSTDIVVDIPPDLPQLIDAGDDVDFTVRCTPTSSSPISTTIRVRSNDPTNPVLDRVFTCAATPFDLEPPADQTLAFCATSENVVVGEATAANCDPSITGQVISTNGVTLVPPLDVTGGQVTLGIGTHVIRWHADDGFQTEDVYQTVTVGTAIQANGTYYVRDRADVQDLGGNPAGVLNSGTGLTSIGGDGATVGGIIAGGDVDVAFNGYVYGDIKAVGDIDVGDPGKHFGNELSVASTGLPPLPTLPPFPPANTTDRWINPNDNVSLPPGNYRSVGVNGNPSPSQQAILRLSAGDYFFTNLYLNSAGLVVVAQPGTRLFVRSNLTFNTSIRTAVGSNTLAPVFLGVAGTGQVALYAPFTGTVVAPNRNLVVGTANGMRYEGAFYAQGIDVTPNSLLVCNAGLTSVTTPTCANGVLNPGETDVDCGGPTCAPCGTGDTCLVGADCTSGVCPLGICVAPACNDGVKNGSETAVDCGGSCSACPVPCSGATYQATSMFHSTGNAWWQGGWNIYSNGYISTSHTFSPGPSVITVRAFGQQALNVLPHMLVTVGGTPIAPTAGVSVGTGGFANYNFTFNATAGAKEIRVVYDNDASGSFGDRNLIVQTVTVACP